ncbi:MAG: ATP-dependent RNA helicase [Bdellovibrionales bacterium]|nr:ATP-dependent RNA helicase [Bdellovibrionales bacterium]
MQYQKISLPIDAYLDEILSQVQKSSTILIKASPGSGKTTRLPWFIAKNYPSKVVVLEPRRLAAKLAAERIAVEEGLKIGAEIGYHFRFEKKTSSSTRLTFYTEGTFLKKAMNESDLDDVGVIILDEFHERHLETDMALAWLLDLQARRGNLKLILMSATLDLEITQHLKSPTIIDIEAVRYPVEMVYLPNQPSVLNQSLEQKIRQALEQIPTTSDVLVFLPGMREIQKVQSYLAERFGKVFILHSEVSMEEQEKALKPHTTRKIILSTNLAESSVTIPSIKAVIDSGIQREAHYSPWNGLKIIADRPVTKSSAVQRAGRAGRTSPGICHRLYALQDFEARESFTQPEILKADLTDTYLLSSQIKSTLRWITPPPADRWQKARQLCYLMGLIDEKNDVTPLAQKTSRYSLDLRLSRVLVAGENLNLNERKQLLNYICRELENDLSGNLLRKFNFYLENSSATNESSWEKCLLAGFIDQVARYRMKQNDFIHYSGKTIKLHPSLGTLTDGYYLILNITQRQEAISILPIEEEWLFEHEPFPFLEETLITVEPKFSLTSFTKLGSIVIDEKNIPLSWTGLNPTQKEKVRALGEKVFAKSLLKWKESEAYNRYTYWLKLKQEDSQDTLSLDEYFKFSSELIWDSLEDYFKQSLEDHGLNQTLPWSINLGGKKELKVHYPFNQDPYVEAPIQDFYGQKETPKIANNKIPLTLKLIGPHRQPLQVTKDLAGFWKKTYQEMLKEFKRDYPRHHWPEDPTTAKPLLLKRHLVT